MKADIQTAIFGGGCFWCTEAIYRRLKGVMSIMPGYAGGEIKKPTYKQVSSGNTGHAEVVKIEFDPRIINYLELLNVFFATHDPTTKDRQGNDVGPQYRSIILYKDEEQKQIANQFIKDLTQSGLNIVTELKLLKVFYEAEDYHQKYYENHLEAPYCQLVIEPKLNKLKVRFNELINKGD